MPSTCMICINMDSSIIINTTGVATMATMVIAAENTVVRTVDRASLVNGIIAVLEQLAATKMAVLTKLLRAAAIAKSIQEKLRKV